MSYFDDKPQAFRVLFGALALYLLILGSINFYRFASTPTDENLFTDVKSRLYVTQHILAEGNEAVHVGDLLITVNGNGTAGLQELDAVLAQATQEAVLQLRVLRSAENKAYSFTVRRENLSHALLRELQPAALVVDVTAGGASDRAGMKVGDLITRINGESFKDANDADRILREAQIGKTIEYEIFRNANQHTLHVTIAPYGVPIYALAWFLSGVVFFGTGCLIALKRPQYPAARLVGLFFLLVSFALMVGPIQRDARPDLLTATRSVTFLLSLLLSFAVALHSHHYFPKERPELLARRWIRVTGYLIALAGVGVTLTFRNPVAFFSSLSATVAFMVAAQVFFRKLASAEYQAMNRALKWSGIAVGIASIAIFLPILSSGIAKSIYLLGYFGLALLLLPAAYLYTIGRYRLLELDLRIRKNVQYSVIAIVWGLVALAALFWSLSYLLTTDLGLPNIRLTRTSIEVAEGPMTPGDRAIWEKTVVVILAIGFTFFFRWVARSGQDVIARKFHRARYDYRRAANELATVMASTLNMNELARGIVEKLTDLMQLKGVGVMFFREQATCCHQADGFDGTTWNKFCISVEKDLVSALQPFTSEANVDYLPKALKDEFRKSEIQYVIPIRSKGVLIGALLIGEKRSEATFQNEDLEFLTAGAKQASVSIENAFLYEELAEQERLKHELAIARRIQLESLPQTTPDIEGLEIAGVSLPALEVGGDYFDYLNGDVSKLTVIVGDVSGKGTSAALYMSKIQGILRSLHAFGLSPRELFVRTNALLCSDMEKKSFVTAMGGFFDPPNRRLVLARAGHLPLFHYHARTGKVDRIVPKGLGLGLNAQGIFAEELEERTVNYELGDIFLFVTDGITEAQQTSGEQFGEDRLVSTLQVSSKMGVADIRDGVLAAVKDFAGDALQHDDQTVVVVKAR